MRFPVFRDRWAQFGLAAAKRGITAIEAVRMARFGFVPELSSPPVQLRPPQEPSWTPPQLQAMTEIHGELLQSDIVEPVEPPDFSNTATRLAIASAMCYYAGVPFLVPAMVMPFVHVMFPVPKPHSTKWRGVSGLKRFNDWIVPRHFKLESLHAVKAMLRPLDYMAVIDLKAAYPTMGIAPRFRDYFIFRFRGKFYRYKGAVFGVSSLPRAFTKLLRPVIAFFRSFGIRLAIFLDDILVCGQTFSSACCDVQEVITVLTHLGFVISTKDAVNLQPRQQVVWCGAMICSLTMQFLLPQGKVKKLQHECRTALKFVLQQQPLTLRKWASILGVMRSTTFAVLPAMLWSQPLRRFVVPHVRPGKSHPCWDQLLPAQPPTEVLDCLRRFASPLLLKYNGRDIRPTPDQILIDSDASGFGGGVVMDKPLQAAARWHWLPDEKEHHINWKELSTPLMGLQSLDLEFPGLVLNAMVRDRCDNSVSVSYINRQEAGFRSSRS